MVGRKSYGLTEAERLLLFNQRQEEQLNQINELLLKGEKDLLAVESLGIILVKAVDNNYLKNIKCIMNSNIKIPPSAIREATRSAVKNNHIHIIKYFANVDKFIFPYAYLADSIGDALFNQRYSLAYEIAAMCSIDDLCKALMIYSCVDKSDVKHFGTTEDIDCASKVEAQKFYKKNLITLEKIAYLKIDNITEEIKKIKSSYKLFGLEKILNKIERFSSKLKNYPATEHELDLLTEINRILFKLDIENVQSLLILLKEHVLKEYMNEKGIISILGEYHGCMSILEQKAVDLENLINEFNLNKLSLNFSASPRNNTINNINILLDTTTIFASDNFESVENPSSCRLL